MRSPPARSAGCTANAQNNSVAVPAGRRACALAARRGCLPQPSAWYSRGMSRARGHSLERGFCLGLVGLCVCLGCSSEFSANGGGAGNASTGGNASGDGGHLHSGGRANEGGASAASAGEGPNGGRANAHAGSAGAGIGGAASGGSQGDLGGAGPHGGRSSGGAGTTGHGGKNGACEITECFVANTCLDKCGGSVVYTGCCACEPPSVNQLTCPGTH